MESEKLLAGYVFGNLNRVGALSCGIVHARGGNNDNM